MSTPTTQLVRPAGAGHETLYVLLLCLAILAVAGSVVLWRGEPEVVSSVQTHQLDARRDLGASEQGIYADLRVTLDEPDDAAVIEALVDLLGDEPPAWRDLVATLRLRDDLVARNAAVRQKEIDEG